MPSVNDDPNRPIYGSSLAGQIPTGDVTPPTGGQKVADDPTQSSELGRNVTNTLRALPGAVPAAMAFPGAVSRLTGGAMAGAGTVAKTAGAVAPYGVPAATGGIVYNASTAPTTPVTPAAAPSAAAPNTDRNALDVRLARTDANTAPGAAAAAPAAPALPGMAVANAPGVRRLLTPDGRVLFTNVADDADPAAPASQLAAGPTAAATGAVDNIAMLQRAGSIYRDIAAMQQPANLPAGYGAVIPVDHQAEHNAAFDEEVLRGAAMRAGGRRAAAMLASADAMRTARLAGPLAAANHQAEADKTFATETGQTQRNTATIAGRLDEARARLEAEAPGRNLQNAETAVRVGNSIATMAAQSRYRKALASGDQNEIDSAENELRAAQGKWEKTFPDQYSVTQLNGGIDPLTGQPRGAGAVVVDRRTGNTKIISPDEAKGQAPAPKYETGKVYKDANGNRATWDGKQFVPIS